MIVTTTIKDTSKAIMKLHKGTENKKIAEQKNIVHTTMSLFHVLLFQK